MSQYATVLSTQPVISKSKRKDGKGTKKRSESERDNKPSSNTCNTSAKIKLVKNSTETEIDFTKFKDQGSSKLDISTEKESHHIMSTEKIKPKENEKHEESKDLGRRNSCIIKSQNLSSFTPAYFEYFNDDEYVSDSRSIGSEEINHLDVSIITTFENKDVQELSFWEKPPETDENTDEEIKTYRVSNNCTPIEEPDGSKVKIDSEFWIKDGNKKLLNNLLYGNYKDEPKKEIVTSSRNHAKFDRPLTTNPISKPLKFAKMKSYNYAQKLVDASENKRNKPSLHTIDRSTPVNKNKNKVRASMDTFKTSGTNSSMQMIHSGRYFDSKNPSIFFQRRQSDKPHIKQKLTKKLLNSKNSSINKYFKKETAKISKKYIHSQSLRSSLEASRNEAQKVNISHRNTYKSKVLYLGRTKKKMQPIFLLKSTKPKKTLDKKTKSTLRIFSKGQAHKVTEGISK